MEVLPIVHNLMGDLHAALGRPRAYVAPCAHATKNGLKNTNVLRASEPALGASLQVRGLQVIAS